MSRENVDLVRRSVEAWNRDGLDGILAYCPEDVVLYPFPDAPESVDGYHGHDGIRAVMAGWLEGFDGYAIEPQEVRDLGDRVLGLGEMTGTIKGSTVSVRQPIAWISWDFRDGTIGRSRWFNSWEDALQAAESDE